MWQIAKNKKRVVVTGVGVIAPNGIGIKDFWNNSFNGISGVSEIDFAKKYKFKSTIGGKINNFDPLKLGLTQEQIHLDRYIQFALCATLMALSESHLKISKKLSENIGVCIANAIAGTQKMEQEFLKISGKGKIELNSTQADQFLFRSSNFNSASAEIAYQFCCRGPCNTLPTGCAAGLDAIGFSFDLIRQGRAKVMITGASEAPLTPMVMAAFDAIGALSKKYNCNPQQASRPYDATRDGFVLGESCGILILEERNFALSRGAPIIAEVLGYGSTSNAFHMTGLPRDGNDLARAIQIALQDACVQPEEINYINSHGSSTHQNDINETSAYKKVFGNYAYQIPISSLKSMCGHALAAANAIETIAALGSLVHQKIHPTINYQKSDPLCDLNYVPNQSINQDVNTIVKNASGFSGIHSALILGHPNRGD